MALDTRDKRAAIISLGLMLGRPLPLADGASADTRGERRMFALTAYTFSDPAARVPSGRVRIAVYNVDGDTLQGYVPTVLDWSYRHEIDRIGSFTVDVPANDLAASTLMESGAEIRLYKEGEGHVFTGRLAKRSGKIGTDGAVIDKWSGPSSAHQLVRRRTLPAAGYLNQSAATIVSSLISVTDFTAGIVDTFAANASVRYEGATLVAALEALAQAKAAHVIFDPVAKTVDLTVAGVASGLILRNVQLTPELAAEDDVIAIGEAEILEESGEIVNRIYPFGAGAGLTAVTLAYSNRSSPYTINATTDSEGKPLYYIEDSASQALFGICDEVVQFKDVVIQANSTVGRREASNQLYDLAATRLTRSKGVKTTYGVKPLGITHYRGGAARFKVGDTVRMIFRGIIQDADGARAYRSIDANLYLMGFERKGSAAGGDDWTWIVSDVDRAVKTDAERLAEVISQVKAVNSALVPTSNHEVHLLGRIAINASYPQAMRVRWDANVTNLHWSRLTFVPRALRSTITVTAAESNHQHVVGVTIATTGYVATVAAGSGNTGAGSSHIHGMASHTHTGPSHTHTEGAHIHSGGAHAHGLNSHTHTMGNHIHSDPSHAHTTGGSPTSANLANLGAPTNNTSDAAAGNTASAGAGDTGSSAGTGTGASGTANTGTPSTNNSDAEAAHTHPAGAHTHAISGSLQRYNVELGSGATGTIDVQAAISGESLWLTTPDALSAHSHGVTYGVAIDPSPPSNPAVQIWINGVNRTVALGGPWGTLDAEVTDLDVTQYLQTDTGIFGTPIQATNTIEFRYGAGDGKSCDIEAQLRSRVTVVGLAPV